MVSTNANNTKKILVNIWKPLIKRLDAKLKDACLKRDPFLDKVLRYEAEMLRKEAQESNSNPNSDDAKILITKSLKSINREQVYLYLSEKTVATISEVCENLNVPRDAFINRVILLLTSSFDINDALFDEDENLTITEYIPDALDSLDDERRLNLRTNVLDIIGEYVNFDPFWLLRGCLEARHKYDDSLSPFLHLHYIKRFALKSLPDIESYKLLETENALFLNCSISDKQLYEEETIRLFSAYVNDEISIESFNDEISSNREKLEKLNLNPSRKKEK